MPHLLVSAAHKSSGKTTLTIGLTRAFRDRGMVVQPFKKGPDYIDPMWLSLSSGRPCHNLDFYTSSDSEIVESVSGYGRESDIIITEGNKGLYDGLDVRGTNSNAALAKLLRSPVVLVLDTRGTIRGLAPLVLGYQAFDTDVHIAGVILNQVGGDRHESKMRAVMEHYTDVPVLGAVRRSTGLDLTERHLGLMPSNEDEAAESRIAGIARIVSEQVDLDGIRRAAEQAPALPMEDFVPPVELGKVSRDLRIGIARDAAFGFYYADDLEALARGGADLVTVNTLEDSKLPEIDGLFIGGGFPESLMEELEANVALRRSVREAIEAGLPVYAECGGLMYLSRSITWQGEKREMVGAIHADTVMHASPRGRGYIQLEETGFCPWPSDSDASGNKPIHAHEFHYSSLENLPAETRFAYRMLRGKGIAGGMDGIVYRNVLACYAHLRNTGRHRWTRRFLSFVRDVSKSHDVGAG
ncbi:MAG: cobyrinate a,c-diamide synthase [Pseudomonadota bacterium]|nr:cobyrinate a,c-diamide synthase [Pseudomonadota bacterium]